MYDFVKIDVTIRIRFSRFNLLPYVSLQGV